MQNYNVVKYTKDYYNSWNAFIAQAKNATFLFHRDFMEYHQDRFLDFSLLVFKNETLIALLPANRVEDALYSHQGLTYGGIILHKIYLKAKVNELIGVLFSFIKSEGIKQVFLKKMPEIYTPLKNDIFQCVKERYPVEEIKNQKLLAIDYSNYKIHKTKLKHYRKGLKNNLEIRKENTFISFWQDVLIPRLKTKHDTKPVHELKEIEQLQSFFSEEIIQYNVYLNNNILAGITIFDKGDIVKSQYGATTLQGEKYYAMDFLFVHLINYYKNLNKHFFSMGTITDHTNKLGYNPGLLRQKIELGCQEYDFKYFKVTLHD